LKTNEKYVSYHGKIIYIIHKSHLHLNLCRVFEPFESKHEFQNLLPINHTWRLLQNIYLNSFKWLVSSNDRLSILWGGEYNFQYCNVTLPLPYVSWHIDLLNDPIEPMVKSSGFPCLLGIVLVDTSLPTVAAVPAQINWYIKSIKLLNCTV
jgi:hypothetical protein